MQQQMNRSESTTRQLLELMSKPPSSAPMRPSLNASKEHSVPRSPACTIPVSSPKLASNLEPDYSSDSQSPPQSPSTSSAAATAASSTSTTSRAQRQPESGGGGSGTVGALNLSTAASRKRHHDAISNASPKPNSSASGPSTSASSPAKSHRSTTEVA